jgi:diadenosine tetraphosphate (Ap4A) HIT family hydrolase
MFSLHPRLAADSVSVLTLSLCEVRLIRDANYPWLILVPQREAIREIHDLSVVDQQLLMEEISRVSKSLQAHCEAPKMNVAALGNMVPQLHIHVVARFESDPSWPGAIWGTVPAVPYTDGALSETVRTLAERMQAAG